MILDHPDFVDVRLEIVGPIYGGTKYYRIRAVWLMKRDGEDYKFIRENFTIEKSVWEKFVRKCRRS